MSFYKLVINNCVTYAFMAKLQGSIELFLFGTICMSAIFVQSHFFTDTYIVPKWLCAISIILGMGLYCSIRLLFARPIKMNVSLAGMGVVILCFLQAIYGLLQYFDLFSSHSIYKVIGSFDNPAGFAACLCAGLPFVGFLLLDKNKFIRYAGWIAGIIIIAAVILFFSDDMYNRIASIYFTSFGSNSDAGR